MRTRSRRASSTLSFSTGWPSWSIDVLMLGDREIIFVAGLFDFQPGGDPGRRGCADEIGIEAGAGADVAGAAASIAEVQRDGIVRVAGNDHDAGFGFARRELQLHVIASLESQALRRRGTDHRGVVPR